MPRGRPTKRRITETNADCVRCQEFKPLTDFYKRGGDKPTPYCKDCQRDVSKINHSKVKENRNAPTL